MNQDPGGIWVTTADSSVDDWSSTMLITEDGQIAYTFPIALPLTSPFIQAHLGTVTTAGNQLSGTANVADITAYETCLENAEYCGVEAVTGAITGPYTETLSGTVTQGQTLITPVPSSIGNAPVMVNWVYSTLYDNPSSVSAVAGTWQGLLTGTIYPSPMYNGIPQQQLTISAAGLLTEQDTNTNCVLMGQISPINPAYNGYTVSWTYNGTDCAPNASSASGIAYVDSSVEPMVLHIAAQVQPSQLLIVVGETLQSAIP